MSHRKRIAIDAMGGDFGPEVTVPASIRATVRDPSLRLCLIGDQQLIEKQLSTLEPQDRQRLSFVHTDAEVLDQDKPTRVLRDKTDSSMYMAVQQVQQGKAEACVSAGNTGALLLSGRHLLKTIPGIQKPAIMATIPGATRNCYLLDVGANVDCKAEQLFQFAVMGSVLAESLGGLEKARVALLNIGVEDYKGSEQVRAAATLLEASEAIHYVGFVEGSTLFEGIADVVVCDGFVGNVTIKSSAGVVRVINETFSDIMALEIRDKLSMQTSTSLFNQLQQRIDPAQYNGASLLGLQGSIIKSHGNATVEGFSWAIERAAKEAENNVPGLITEKVAQIIGVLPATQH